LNLFVVTATPFDLQVNTLTFNNHAVFFGPIPGQIFMPSVQFGVPILTQDASRWNPWIGTEVVQNTQIALIVENLGVLPIGIFPWFTCEPLTGRATPNWGP